MSTGLWTESSEREDIVDENRTSTGIAGWSEDELDKDRAFAVNLREADNDRREALVSERMYGKKNDESGSSNLGRIGSVNGDGEDADGDLWSRR